MGEPQRKFTHSRIFLQKMCLARFWAIKKALLVTLVANQGFRLKWPASLCCEEELFVPARENFHFDLKGSNFDAVDFWVRRTRKSKELR
jgi:hypothetical protein